MSALSETRLTVRSSSMKRADDDAEAKRQQAALNQAQYEVSVERAEHILETVAARELLANIRDENWGEGELEEIQTNNLRGVGLVTKVPSLEMESPGLFHLGRGRLTVVQVPIKVAVTLSPLTPDEPMILDVHDRGMLTQDRQDKLKHLIIIDLIKEGGLTRSLSYLIYECIYFQGLAYGGGCGGCFTCSEDENQLREQFNTHFVSVTDYREIIHSLPHQMREIIEPIIEQLSPFMAGRDYAESPDLVAWEKDILTKAGTTNPSLLKRIFRQPFLLLKPPVSKEALDKSIP